MKSKLSRQEFDPRIKILRKQAQKLLTHITNLEIWHKKYQHSKIKRLVWKNQQYLDHVIQNTP